MRKRQGQRERSLSWLVEGSVNGLITNALHALIWADCSGMMIMQQQGAMQRSEPSNCSAMQSLALHCEVKSYDKMKYNTFTIERAGGLVLWEAAVQCCLVKGCWGKDSFRRADWSAVERNLAQVEGVEVKYIVSKCRRVKRVSDVQFNEVQCRELYCSDVQLSEGG